MDSDPGPTAPELFLSLIQGQQRGRLKLYIDYTASAGTSLEMLREAQRLRRHGIDVVIGHLAPLLRPEIGARIGELEQLPHRRIEYHGVAALEMDLEAILARRPTVCLVDDLAHTNAPGSRNAKRHLDVEELLRRGINVISTLHVQCLEGLRAAVEEATGEKPRENVPDYVVRLADQLVLVEPPDVQADSQDNGLAAAIRLRDLAVQVIARRLGRPHAEQQDEIASASTDKLMAALSPDCSAPEAFVRKAARLAERLAASWYVVHVQTGRHPLSQEVHGGLALAQQLGAVPLTFKGQDVAGTLLAFVREYGITHVLVGKARVRRHRWWPRRGMLDTLLASLRGVDILLADVAEHQP